MARPNECWVNFYASGQHGMFHWTREEAEIAGAPSSVERRDVGAIYRIHARLKALAHTPADRGTP
jgi:hypothetical protein